MFETKPIKHDIQIPEGNTVLFGGFLTASNSAGIPIVPVIAGNPILGYITGKSPRKGDDPEIVVLLTPRLPVDAIENTAPVRPLPSNTLTRAESPAPATAVTPPASTPKVDPPAPGIVTPVIAVAAPTSSAAPGADLKLVMPEKPPSVSPSGQLPTTSTLAPSGRFYSVQVGAFGQSANAEALATEVKKNFDDVFVDQVTTGGTTYRVRVGRLARFSAAKELQLKLEEQGFDSYIVPPDSP